MEELATAALRDVINELTALGITPALWVGGSRTTVDYISGVSDTDLVAVVSGPMSQDTIAAICSIRRDLDAHVAVHLSQEGEERAAQVTIPAVTTDSFSKQVEGLNVPDTRHHGCSPRPATGGEAVATRLLDHRVTAARVLSPAG